MRYLRLALLPLVFAACADTQAPLKQTPQFDFANAPDFTGIVERASGGAWASWGDPVAGTRVTIGLDMVEWCSEVYDFDELHWADKYLPNVRLNSLNAWDDARITVWPFFAFDCGLFTTVQPLASGLGQAMYLDNDLFGSPNANTNTWGFMAHGTLAWTADGTPAQLSAHLRWVWKKGEPAQIITRKIVLK